MAANDAQSIEDWQDDVVEVLDEESRNAAAGSLEALIQLCDSSALSVTAIDRNGHSLLRYALKDLHVEKVRVLLERGSDPNSLEPESITYPNPKYRVSHLGFLVNECERLSCRPSLRSPSLPKTKELQRMLLQHGADLTQTHSGYNLSQDLLFYGGICGGDLQFLLPLYLSNSPHINLEAVDTNTGYTRLLSVCHSTYDPYSDKVNAVRILIHKGANVRACCETLGNSALHLALLSARDEVLHSDGTWKGKSEQLRYVLASLVRGNARIDIRNLAGLTPADVAIGLGCVNSWNKAMEDCDLLNHMIDMSSDVSFFRQELFKQFKFDKFWEDYNHSDRFHCQPDTCCPDRWLSSAKYEQCHWWEEYRSEWLLYWTWDIKKSEWEEL